MQFRIALASLLACVALASFAGVSTVLADEYTCDDDGPCIVDAEDLGNYKVALQWSGQGTRYDFFKIIVGIHGGGAPLEYPLKGRNGGMGRFNLLRAGDYEITVSGCYGSRKRPADASCIPSSEKVRMNLN
jgi:hypothetical protein